MIPLAPIDDTIASLRHQIASCEAQLQALKSQLEAAEAQYAALHRSSLVTPIVPNSEALAHALNGGVPDDWRKDFFTALGHNGDVLGDETASRWPLEREEYKRYGRQLIMPEVGLQGQLRLKSSSILIVGVGGLGCPAAAYLAGAGVGTIGLVDGDTVEESNLHRQILHSTNKVGMSKVDSAMVDLKSLNPTLNYIPHRCRLLPSTALSIFANYDLILDCTDTPASRYLISDACVLLQKPLISAAALRTDGQLMVLNNPPLPPGDMNGGPCYRCVFPKPPPAESVISCGDGGVLGPCVGVMGVLQALEAIKIVVAGIRKAETGLLASSGASPMETDTGSSINSSSRAAPPPSPPGPSTLPSLLIFSAYSATPFRTMRLRRRRTNCLACSAHAAITPEALASGSMDYVQFCGAVSPVRALKPEERISAVDYARVRQRDGCGAPSNTPLGQSQRHILVDVREKVQYDLCSLEGSINIPFSEVSATVVPSSSIPTPASTPSPVSEATVEPGWVRQLKSLPPEKPIFVICRLGNDSQLAVRKMKKLGLDEGGKRWIGDITGGLWAWREGVDAGFPEY